MNLDIEAFAQGAWDRLQEKQAGANILDAMANENILPHISGQRNWRYARTPDALRLSDGDKVYSFGMGELGGEAGRVAKLNDVPLLDFESDKTSGGTAQIHRSSPDSIYLTLADGKANPTFRLEHEEGKNWKYIPSKKMLKRLEQLKSHGDQKGPADVSTPKVDIDAMMQGGMDQMKTASVGTFLFGNGLSSIADPNARGMVQDMALYSNPFTGVATGLYDTGNHLLHGRFLSALGSAGMGALSFLPGAGSAARGAVGLGKGLLRGLGRGAVRAGERAVGTEGMAVAKNAIRGTQKAMRPAVNMAAKAVEPHMGKATNFVNRGREMVNEATNKITNTVQGFVPPKHTQWEHGLQNPIVREGGKVHVRTPFQPNFNLGTNLRSGMDAAVRNPLGVSEFFHPYGVGGDGGEAVDLPDQMWKASSMDGIFGGATGAADFINGGLSGAKSLLQAAGRHPLGTMAATVAAGTGLNKLREGLSEEHREEMEENPGKRRNRELAIPLLAGMTAAAVGGAIK